MYRNNKAKREKELKDNFETLEHRIQNTLKRELSDFKKESEIEASISEIAEELAEEEKEANVNFPDINKKLCTIDTKLSDDFKKFIFDNPEYFSPKIIPPENEKGNTEVVNTLENEERNFTFHLEPVGKFFEELPTKRGKQHKIKKTWRNKHQHMNRNSIDKIMRSTYAVNKFINAEKFNNNLVIKRNGNHSEERIDKNWLSI